MLPGIAGCTCGAIVQVNIHKLHIMVVAVIITLYLLGFINRWEDIDMEGINRQLLQVKQVIMPFHEAVLAVLVLGWEDSIGMKLLIIK